MIEVRHLRKTFQDLRRGEVVAVEDLSFTARAGEIVGLLGPNGAGKTTALRILCTVLRPTSGSASVAGYDVATQPEEVRRHLGFASANTGVYDRMTAWEFVHYFGKLHGMPEPLLQARMAELFSTLQMNDFRDVLGAKMSTGMKQKASIARTIVHDPPVLVFDEPTSGLDVLVARNVLDGILRLRSEGKCILFSTHIMSEVARLCDRVIILHRGHVLAAGTPAELREQCAEHDLEELFFKLVRRSEPADATQ